jgi:hypothetical protein
VSGESPSCSCLPDFMGSPPRCRPECVSNSECASHVACVDHKCRDPCPGLCGVNAECRVVSHTPTCVCVAGFFGDPFVQCLALQCKAYFLMFDPVNELGILKALHLCGREGEDGICLLSHSSARYIIHSVYIFDNFLPFLFLLISFIFEPIIFHVIHRSDFEPHV